MFDACHAYAAIVSYNDSNAVTVAATIAAGLDSDGGARNGVDRATAR